MRVTYVLEAEHPHDEFNSSFCHPAPVCVQLLHSEDAIFEHASSYRRAGGAEQVCAPVMPAKRQCAQGLSQPRTSPSTMTTERLRPSTVSASSLPAWALGAMPAEVGSGSPAGCGTHRQMG